MPGSTGGLCVTSKSVEVRKNYLADNINFQDVITTQLEVFFVNSGAKDSLSAWLTQIATYQTVGNYVATLTVGAVTFTDCKVIKFDTSPEPESINNAIQRGYVNLTIEERTSGDLDNVKVDTGDFEDAGSNLGALLELYGADLDGITEDISYSTGVNGQFSLRHSVSVTPNNRAGHTWAAPMEDLGLTIARQILDSYLPTAASSANSSSIHKLLVSTNGIVGNLSASINRITGEASITRNIDLLSNVDGNYDVTYDYTHTLDMDSEGVIKVTESGKILSTGKHGSNVQSYYTAAVADLPNQLTNAATRCGNVFTDYVVTAGKLDMSFNGVAIPPLSNTPMETVKNFNEISQQISYSVSFTNNENVLPFYTIDRSTDINKDKDGIITLNEKTSFLSHYEKCDHPSGQNALLTDYNADVGGAFARAFAVWTDFNTIANGATLNFKLISRDLSWNPDGKNLSYSITYSADNTVAVSGGAWETNGIKKLTLSTTDKLPQRMIQEYPIAPIGMLVHNPGQTNLGSRTATVTTVLDRVNSYSLSSPAFPSVTVPYIASIVRAELLNVFAEVGTAPSDIFISDLSYNYDSKRSLTLTATAQYLATR
jgi:hypothetical protein